MKNRQSDNAEGRVAKALEVERNTIFPEIRKVERKKERKLETYEHFPKAKIHENLRKNLTCEEKMFSWKYRTVKGERNDKMRHIIFG